MHLEDIAEKREYYRALAVAMIEILANEESTFLYCKDIMYNLLVEMPWRNGDRQVLNAAAFIVLENKWQYALDKHELIQALTNFIKEDI